MNLYSQNENTNRSYFLGIVIKLNKFAGVIKIAADGNVSAATTFDFDPGVEMQDLHRDGFIWQRVHANRPQSDYV